MTRRTPAVLLFLIGFGLATESTSQSPSRTIEVHARRFAFQPGEITVNKGETIQLKLLSDDVPHSLQVKDLGIDETATRNKPGEATFTPTRSGTFQGQCGRFCGEGHGKMTFIIRVNGE